MSNRNPRKIYVSNISRDTRERDLGRLFEETGRIERLQFKNRFAFIEYERSRGSDDAVHKFDGMYFMGRRLRVEPYCYRGGDRKYRSDKFSNDYRIYICKLDSMTSWQDLKDFGRTAGKSVTFADVRVIRDDQDYDHKHGGGRNQLEGIIEYSDIRDFENALKELDGARLNGVRVQVYSKSSYDRNKFSEDDHNDKGRGNARSPSRSRSRSRDRGTRRRYLRSHSQQHYEKENGDRDRTRNRSRTRSRSRDRNTRHMNRRNSASPSHSRSRSPDLKKKPHDINNGNYKSHSPSRSPSRSRSYEK